MSLEQVQNLVESYFPEYVKDLEFITNIDSGSNDKAGSQMIAEFLADKLKAGGAQTQFVNNETSTHLIVRFRGCGKVRILMLAHIDTVFDTGTAKQRPFRIDEEKRAYGPGVGDDKATVIQTVYIMKALQELGINDYGEIVIYYNGQEEIGSQEAEEIITRLAQEVDLCIVMDTARPQWGIVTKRKGRATYRIDVAGKPGHAGNSAQDAASATVELANQILKFHSLATPILADSAEKRDSSNSEQRCSASIPDITVNVGIVGTRNDKTNIVPADAFAEVEVRAFDLADLKRIDTAVQSFNKELLVLGTRVTIDGAIHNVPLEKTEQAKQLIDQYRQIVKKTYQRDVWEEAAGGVTDGNVAAIYVPTIDGLGIENYNEHTAEEWVDLKTVVPRTVVLILLLKELCR